MQTDNTTEVLPPDSSESIALTTVSTPEASAILADIAAKRESFAKWIEDQIAKL